MTILIKQRGSHDCGVAALAMYLRASYEQAAAVYGSCCAEDELWTPEVPVTSLGLLYAADAAGYPSARLIEFFSGSPALVEMQSINFENADHLVFWDGFAVFDPALGNVVATRDEMLGRSFAYIQRIDHLAPIVLRGLADRVMR